MTKINDLPDDPKYTIKFVGAQTGILPVTIRAWERRYKIPKPHRSNNHYRLYSDRDIAILTWIKNRVETGISISSAVLEMHQIEQNGIFPEAPSRTPDVSPQPPRLSAPQYSLQLYRALVRHDENQAGALLDEILTGQDLLTVFSEILTPCLVEIGEAWYRGEIKVATEHFASTFIRGRLLALMQNFPNRRNAPHILAGCAPSEQHEIGSLMVAILLRQAGYRVEYLGPDIPLSDLIEYAGEELPNMVILSATTESSAVELIGMGQKLSKLRVPPMFGYGGRAFVFKPALRQKMDGVFLGGQLSQAVNTVREMLKAARPNPVRRSVMYV